MTKENGNQNQKNNKIIFLVTLLIGGLIITITIVNNQIQKQAPKKDLISEKPSIMITTTPSPVPTIFYQKSGDETIDYSQIKAGPDALADMTINVWQDNIGHPFARIIYLEKNRQEFKNSLASGYQNTKIGDKEAYFITRLYGDEEIYTYFIFEAEQKIIKIIGYLPGPNSDRQERKQALQRFETILNTVRVAN